MQNCDMIDILRMKDMYFVDKDQLILKLTYLNQLIKDYESNKGNHYAFERIAQMLIESSVDIGNMIIDGFILRIQEIIKMSSIFLN